MTGSRQCDAAPALVLTAALCLPRHLLVPTQHQTAALSRKKVKNVLMMIFRSKRRDQFSM